MTFEVILSCLIREVVAAPWGIHVPMVLGWKTHTPLLLCIEFLPKLLYIDLYLLSKKIYSGQVEPNYCLFKLDFGQIVEISHNILQLATYTFGVRDFQLAC